MAKSKSSKSGTKVASATTSRTGQVGAAETKVTPVEDDGKAKAAAPQKTTAKAAPARAGHSVGFPRKSAEEKFGPAKVTDEQKADVARQQAALGGI